MPSGTASVFRLPRHLEHKSSQELLADDERQLRMIGEALNRRRAELTDQLDAARRAATRRGQAALERDVEIRRLSRRLAELSRFSLDLCLGRIVPVDGGAPVYIGRSGLADSDGNRLLIDWRTPAAEPFFAATAAAPLAIASRRRYRWSQGVITDYWDEVLTPGISTAGLALDEDSALLASLAESRSSQMRDVLATLQADQNAIIRADSRGALVVDGGPGTGKTVVALHRAAYLLHADPLLGPGRGGVLVVGPHQPYLHYVADVLPRLGEESVQTCTIADLAGVGELPAEADPAVTRLKETVQMVEAIERAVAIYEEPPSQRLEVETPEAEFTVSKADWARAFGSVNSSTPHNEARDRVWEALIDDLLDQVPGDSEIPETRLRRDLMRDPELRETFSRAWPIIEPTDLVGDLWSAPAYLRHCAPHLTEAEIRALQREAPLAWTSSDRPLLDAARRRLGDPHRSAAEQRRTRELAARTEEMDAVVSHLLEADDDPEDSIIMLRGADLRATLDDDPATTNDRRDQLAGPFAHVIVDEAQELSDAEWQMLLSRCPTRSFTIVGDRAQARQGFTESWAERLERVGLRQIRQSSLTINYRTPAEIMDAAAPVIRAVLPDANVPTSIREGGHPVLRIGVTDRDALVDEWLATHPDGVACVIGDPGFNAGGRVASLAPAECKGLEFDLVLLHDPDSWGTDLTAAVDTYVAMTRATRRLVVTHP
ncbi:RNA polymerase recycling motor ATPase HelR [Nocardioides sp. Bht2]|uniref:RNA polymerase recycling motor ATPase HelR n=1 Tax=Nocardioides sp. Bht2 TaxID=3392297 RepID=UPI0039B46F7D